MAFGLWSRTLDHLPKSFKALKMVHKWVSGSLSLCLVLLGFFSANPAFAGSPPSKWAAEGSSSFIHPSYQAACSATFSTLPVSPVWQSEGSPVYTVESVMSVYCKQPGFWMNGSYKITEDKAARVTGKCENGSAPSGSDINNACPQLPTPTPTPTPTPPPICNEYPRTVVNIRTTKNQFAQCIGGCLEIYSGCGYAGDSLVLDWFGSPTMDCRYSTRPGKPCTAPPEPDDPNCPPDCSPTPAPTPNGTPVPSGPPTPIPTPAPLPKDCGAGMCYGEVNGVGICIKCIPIDKTDKVTKVTNADGSITEITTKTTCDGDRCTTKTTTKTIPPPGSPPPAGGGDGTTTETTKKDEPVSDFCKTNPLSEACKDRDDADKKDGLCKQNPDLDICKKGSWTASTCESPPSCSGDPVQCAQAKAAFKAACETEKLNESLTGDSSKLGTSQGIVDAAIGEANNMGEGGLIPSAGNPVGIGSFDQTNPWGSTCPADRTIAAFEGHNIEFKLSEYCSIFQLMGTLAVAFTLLAAGLFVFKD